LANEHIKYNSEDGFVVTEETAATYQDAEMGFVGLLKKVLLGIEDNKRLLKNAELHGHDLVMIYSPDNEVDLAIIKGILEGENIPYFVHNEYFGSLKVGPRIPLLNQKTLMVSEQHKSQATDIIKDFLETVNLKTEIHKSSGYSWMDKIRVTIEVAMAGWIVPGTVWNRDKKDPSRSLPKDDWIPILINVLLVSFIFLALFLSFERVYDLIEKYFRRHAYR
jgi:Putative prokaryotic signal transducing protein